MEERVLARAGIVSPILGGLETNGDFGFSRFSVSTIDWMYRGVECVSWREGGGFVTHVEGVVEE